MYLKTLFHWMIGGVSIAYSESSNNNLATFHKLGTSLALRDWSSWETYSIRSLQLSLLMSRVIFNLSLSFSGH